MAGSETSFSDLFDSATPLDIRGETHHDENIASANDIPAQSFDKNIPDYMDETDSHMEKVWEDKQSLGYSIDVLNDDCLMHVFSFLNHSQRLDLEKVCKRWQEISYIMWHRIHSLDFTSPSMSCLPLRMITLKRLLKRCNTNLLTLNLCVEYHTLNAKTLKFIAKYCSSLEELYISKLPINQRCLLHLAKNCTWLKKIVFNECKYFTDNDLLKWFSKSQALTSITITRTEGINGSSLKALNTPLEYLNLSFCNSLNINILTEYLARKCSTLQNLSLDACTCLKSSDVSRIVETVPNLKFFSLSQRFPLLNQQSLLSLGNLTHLQELNLKYNECVNDQIVAAIVAGCKELTVVNISGCKSNEGAPFTSEGIGMLGKLPKLISLNISYLRQTNDVCLKKLTANSTRLKFIKCIGCPELSDRGCSLVALTLQMVSCSEQAEELMVIIKDHSTRVLSLCHDLEQWDLSGNDRVTNETVRTALDSVKLFTNRKPLELIVGGTSVDITSDDNRLIINQEDFCKIHLRPDFIDFLNFSSSDEDEFRMD